MIRCSGGGGREKYFLKCDFGIQECFLCTEKTRRCSEVFDFWTHVYGKISRILTIKVTPPILDVEPDTASKIKNFKITRNLITKSVNFDGKPTLEEELFCRKLFLSNELVQHFSFPSYLKNTQ